MGLQFTAAFLAAAGVANAASSSSGIASVTFGLPPVELPSSSSASLPDLSLGAVPASVVPSATSSAVSAVGTPLSIFGIQIEINPLARKAKRQSTGGLYLDADGYASTTCTEQYSITDGRLFTTSGQQYSSGQYTFAVFAAADQVDGFDTEFTGQNVGDPLAFVNSAFDNGQASFCIPPLDPDYVYAVYEDTIDGCQSVTLRITDCSNTDPVSTPSAPVTNPDVSASVTEPLGVPSSTFDPNLNLSNLPGSGVGASSASTTPAASASIFSPGAPDFGNQPASGAPASVTESPSGSPVFGNEPASGQASATQLPSGVTGGNGVAAINGTGNSTNPAAPVTSSPSVIVYREVIYVIECAGYLPQSVVDQFNSGMINYYCDSTQYYYAKMCPVCPIVRAYSSNNTFAERPCPVCPAEIMQQASFQQPSSASGLVSYASPQCVSCPAVSNSTMPLAPAGFNSSVPSNSTSLPRLTTVQVPCNVCPAPSTAIVVPSAAASSISSIAAASGVPAAQTAAQNAINSALTITQTVSRLPQATSGSSAPATSTVVNLPCPVCPSGLAVATVAQTYIVPHMTGAPRAGTSAAASAAVAAANNAPASASNQVTSPQTAPSFEPFKGAATILGGSVVLTAAAIVGTVVYILF